MNLFIRLAVNGEVKQNGNTSQFIFTPEEQIAYASNILSLDSGDVFSCGTCGGVGQGTNTFLKAGDVMETEIEGLGKMRNRFVAEVANRPHKARIMPPCPRLAARASRSLSSGRRRRTGPWSSPAMTFAGHYRLR